HLVRHLVDWFQRSERQRHSKSNSTPQSPPPDDDSKSRLRASNPGDTLINCTSVIPKLVEEGKAEVILDTLRAYNQLPYVDKEALVLCLAVVSKQSDQKKLVTDAHSSVRELCTNTHLFFLFIQISKMISKQTGHSGWGRGLRRAVNEWYLSWEPRRLALEVTRHFSAYGWTHRDVIRLAHLKLKELPLGTQVVLHYVFMGLEKTVQEYTGKDNTSELLELMQVLDKDGHPQANLLNPSSESSHALPSKLVERLTHSDVTSGCVTPTQVLMALHSYEHPTRFVGDAGGKIFERKPSKGVAGKIPRAPVRTPSKKNTKVNPQVVDALHTLITASAKVTGHEGAAVTILALTSGGTNPAATTLAFSENTLTEIQVTEGMTLLQLINKFKETVIGEVNVGEALKWAKENEADTVVVLTHKFEQHVIYSATQSLQQLNDANSTHIRLVLCGLGTKHVHPQQTENFLLVLGFDQRTPSIIRAFHECSF
ncbi:60 kDa SS-A/Ro ribonucleoprotein-like, partial [Homarus americanus]